MQAVEMDAVGMQAVGMDAVGMHAVGMDAVGMDAVVRARVRGAKLTLRSNPGTGLSLGAWCLYRHRMVRRLVLVHVLGEVVVEERVDPRLQSDAICLGDDQGH